jgi:hypothetical protein
MLSESLRMRKTLFLIRTPSGPKTTPAWLWKNGARAASRSRSSLANTASVRRGCTGGRTTVESGHRLIDDIAGSSDDHPGRGCRDRDPAA